MGTSPEAPQDDTNTASGATAKVVALLLMICVGVGGWAGWRYLKTERAQSAAPATTQGIESSDTGRPPAVLADLQRQTDALKLPDHWARPVATTNPVAVSVDLLGNLDLPHAIIRGDWISKDGGVNSDMGTASRIDLGYRPPAEYDFKFTFARLAGNDALDTILSIGGRQVLWTIAGWDNTVCGFNEVCGKAADANSTTSRRDDWLKNGDKHACLIKVRTGKVQAFLDEQLVSELSTNGDDLGIGLPIRRLRRPDTLGFSSWNSSYAIYSAELVELAGNGNRVVEKYAPLAIPIAQFNYSVDGRAPVRYTLFSNGHLTTPESPDLWYLKDKRIYFRFGGFLDTCRLSADGKSFTGSNQVGATIAGELLSGGVYSAGALHGGAD